MKELFDIMAEKGRSALDNDSVYAVYQKLSPEQKRLADQMAEKGRSALDNDSVYAVYQKNSTQSKPQPVEPQKTVLDQIVSGLKTGTQAAFPRLSESESPDYSQGIAQGLKLDARNLVRGVLDVASLPGRTLATLSQAPGLSEITPGISQTEVDRGGIPGIVENITRSPFSIMPGTGETAGYVGSRIGGSYLPKLAETIGGLVAESKAINPVAKSLSTPIAQATRTAATQGLENVGVGAAESFANETEQKPIGDFILGSGFGLIPGIGKYVKERNTADVVNAFRTNTDFGKLFPESVDKKWVKDVTGEYLDNLYNRMKAEGVDVGILPKDVISRVKKVEELNALRDMSTINFIPETIEPMVKNRETSIVDLGSLLAAGAGGLGFGVPGAGAVYGGTKATQLIRDKAPSIEKIITNKLIDNLFVPQAYSAGARSSSESRY